MVKCITNILLKTGQKQSEKNFFKLLYCPFFWISLSAKVISNWC